MDNTCLRKSFTSTLAGIYKSNNSFTLKHEGRRLTVNEPEREGAYGGGEEWHSAKTIRRPQVQQSMASTLLLRVSQSIVLLRIRAKPQTEWDHISGALHMYDGANLG